MTTLLFYGLYFCLAVGPIQLIGSIIRDIRLIDRTSKYALGLANYHKCVGLFWMIFILAIVLHNVTQDFEKYMFFLIPGASSALAIYYWVVIFTYSKESKN